MMKPFVQVLCYLSLVAVDGIEAQDNLTAPVNLIIQKIAGLESVKDPKCYATANRLEDFMYGTPLTDEARNLRIEVQKEIALYARTRASALARSANRDVITRSDMVAVLDSIATVGRLKDGDYFFQADTQLLRIRKLDLQQYGSVAYGLRSILSVEHDLMFVDNDNLLPLDEESVDVLNGFLNLATLASLSMGDMIARHRNLHEISETVMRESWIRILQRPENQALFSFQYPRLTKTEGGNEVLKKVIQQKVASYDQYNQLSTSVFLRNIQVFFARQKWPVDEKASTGLRTYFLESLIEFTKGLVRHSHQLSQSRKDGMIRIRDVQQAIQLFLPFKANDFEDIIYFPNDEENRITIEAYDLDAFRDGGIHWRILDYALDDHETFRLSIDPVAAELVVEGVAQLGVLVLRVAGGISHQQGHDVLMIDDLEKAFQRIQELINRHPDLPADDHRSSPVEATALASSLTPGAFQDVTNRAGLQFEHRSSDWLSRLIRSYVYSAEDTTAKLAIPPAFGGSGVASEDINNDGLVDVLLLGGVGNRLYLNDSGGVFRDITGQVPINVWDEEKKSYGEARQPVIADFDNDGLQDMLITYVDDMHRVLKNTGDLRFEDRTLTAGLDGRGEVAGPATVFDYDHDGLLDIFIGYFGNYLKGVLPTLSRNNQNGMPNRLYRNLGDFRFQEVTFTVDSLTDNGWTQAVGHTDINQDGRQDLIVGNDFGVNRYYLNDPEKGFIEMSRIWKTDKPSYTMNVGIGDINYDQHPDLYISNIVVMQKEEKYVSPNEQTIMKFNPEKMDKIRTVEANDLFVSNVKGREFEGYLFSDAVGRGYSSTGWSWDADFFDYDNDGDEDLYCLNGMNDFRVYSNENPEYYGADGQHQAVTYAESDRERNVFFVNEDGFLVNRAGELGTDLLGNSRSAAYLDYDNDGDLDILINNYHDKAVLLENRAGQQQNWIGIRLVGDPASGVNRDAIGSSITLDSGSGRMQWREVHSTTGYLSAHPKEQHFGLGSADKVDIEIKWSNGMVKKLRNLPVNRRHMVQYPDIILY